MVACLETFLPIIRKQKWRYLKGTLHPSGETMSVNPVLLLPRVCHSSFLSLPYRGPIRNFRANKQCGVVVRQSLSLTLLAFLLQAAGFDILASTIR